MGVAHPRSKWKPDSRMARPKLRILRHQSTLPGSRPLLIAVSAVPGSGLPTSATSLPLVFRYLAWDLHRFYIAHPVASTPAARLEEPQSIVNKRDAALYKNTEWPSNSRTIHRETVL